MENEETTPEQVAALLSPLQAEMLEEIAVWGFPHGNPQGLQEDIIMGLEREGLVTRDPIHGPVLTDRGKTVHGFYLWKHSSFLGQKDPVT